MRRNGWYPAVWRLWCLDGEISKKINKLNRLTAVERQIRPNVPHQLQQSLPLTGWWTPTMCSRQIWHITLPR